jgi:hypothetical protein
MRKKREHFEDEQTALELARAAEGVARDNQLAELRDLLADVRVRKLLWRIMEAGAMFSDPWNPNALTMARSTGQASGARYILKEILEANPEAWIVMQQDAYRSQIDALAEMEREDSQATE